MAHVRCLVYRQEISIEVMLVVHPFGRVISQDVLWRHATVDVSGLRDGRGLNMAARGLFF
jgi:hypothetical protein